MLIRKSTFDLFEISLNQGLCNNIAITIKKSLARAFLRGRGLLLWLLSGFVLDVNRRLSVLAKESE